MKPVEHTWKAASYDKNNVADSYKCKTCGTVAKVYSTVEAAEKAGAKETATVNGQLIGWNYTVVSTTATPTKDHTWAVSASKVVNGKIVPTEVTCGLCGKKITAIYKKGQAPAGSTVLPVPGFADYEFVTSAGKTNNGGNTTSGSPKTFDAGVAMYAGMALMSVAGSAVVIGKKKEF